VKDLRLKVVPPGRWATNKADCLILVALAQHNLKYDPPEKPRKSAKTRAPKKKKKRIKFVKGTKKKEQVCVHTVPSSVF
jgi:hypothetical protein